MILEPPPLRTFFLLDLLELDLLESEPDLSLELPPHADSAAVVPARADISKNERLVIAIVFPFLETLSCKHAAGLGPPMSYLPSASLARLAIPSPFRP